MCQDFLTSKQIILDNQRRKKLLINNNIKQQQIYYTTPKEIPQWKQNEEIFNSNSVYF